MSDFLKITGNKVRANEILAQANQLKNFMKINLERSGLSSSIRRLRLGDGSSISIRLYKDANSSIINSVTNLFGAIKVIQAIKSFSIKFYGPNYSRKYHNNLEGSYLDPEPIKVLVRGNSAYHSPFTTNYKFYQTGDILSYLTNPLGVISKINNIYRNDKPTSIDNIRLIAATLIGDRIFVITSNLPFGISIGYYDLVLSSTDQYIYSPYIYLVSSFAIASQSTAFSSMDGRSFILNNTDNNSIYKIYINNDLTVSVSLVYSLQGFTGSIKRALLNTFSSEFSDDYTLTVAEKVSYTDVDYVYSNNNRILIYKYIHKDNTFIKLPIDGFYYNEYVNQNTGEFTTNIYMPMYVSPDKDLYIVSSILVSRPNISTPLSYRYVLKVINKGVTTEIYSSTNSFDFSAIPYNYSSILTSIPQILCIDNSYLLGISISLPKTHGSIVNQRSISIIYDYSDNSFDIVNTYNQDTFDRLYLNNISPTITLNR
jgi:hypothetical protein